MLAGPGPRIARGRTQDLEVDAALGRPVGDQARGRVGLVLDDERAWQPRYPLTLNAPRMNGWMRQKYVYVPSDRFVGVCHVSRFAAAGAATAGPCRARPESNVDRAVGAAGRRCRSGALQGAVHDGDRVEDVPRRVEVAERQRLAALDDRRPAGRAARVRSPWL